MKTIEATLTSFLIACMVATADTNAPCLSHELIGAWQPGERLIQQPPPDLWQDIKDITFFDTGIVEWSQVKNGKMEERIGRYAVLPDPQSMRKLPKVWVSTTNYPDAKWASLSLLCLKEVEIDFDSRFNRQLQGKALKAVTPEGKHLIFLRKAGTANNAMEHTEVPRHDGSVKN